jgi:hypothetical protein
VRIEYARSKNEIARKMVNLELAGTVSTVGVCVGLGVAERDRSEVGDPVAVGETGKVDDGFGVGLGDAVGVRVTAKDGENTGVAVGMVQIASPRE